MSNQKKIFGRLGHVGVATGGRRQHQLDGRVHVAAGPFLVGFETQSTFCLLVGCWLWFKKLEQKNAKTTSIDHNNWPDLMSWFGEKKTELSAQTRRDRGGQEFQHATQGLQSMLKLLHQQAETSKDIFELHMVGFPTDTSA